MWAEHFDDYVGMFTRIHVSEERSWKRALDEWDYVDQYLTAAIHKGLVYTR